MKHTYKFLLLLLFIGFVNACTKEKFPASNMIGLWKQTSVTEDGISLVLSPEQSNCKLLIDENGSYRCFQPTFTAYNDNKPVVSFGAWDVLDDKWVNFSVDKWMFVAPLTSDSAKVIIENLKDSDGKLILDINGNPIIDTTATVQKQWVKYHIQSRCTILKLTSTEMEIRYKTFVGEKKYALLFVPDPGDFVKINVAAGRTNYAPKLITEENYWSTQKEFQTQKTYIFKFQKETN